MHTKLLTHCFLSANINLGGRVFTDYDYGEAGGCSAFLQIFDFYLEIFLYYC